MVDKRHGQHAFIVVTVSCPRVFSRTLIRLAFFNLYSHLVAQFYDIRSEIQ